VAWTPPGAWVSDRHPAPAEQGRCAPEPQANPKAAFNAQRGHRSRGGSSRCSWRLQVWSPSARARVRTDLQRRQSARDPYLTVDNPKPEPLRVMLRRIGSRRCSNRSARPSRRASTISPRIAGTWRWVGDRELEFAPDEDLAGGNRNSGVSMTKKWIRGTARSPLENYSFDFATAPFTAQVAVSEFYQDPGGSQISNASS